MRGWLPVGLVLLATLAGCIGSDGTGTDDRQILPETTGEAPVETEQLARPNWTVGQYWTWDAPTLGGEYSYVVTGEEEGHWIVDTDSRQIAFYDAQTDVSFLGPVRKSDLAGSQADTRVEYFHWPLVENDSWTTTWDGVERTIRVTSVEDGVAELEARQEGRLAVTYEYRADTGWFGDVTFHGPNVTANLAAELVDAGTGFTGEPIRWGLETIIDEEVEISFPPQNWGGYFTVGEKATDVWISFNATCPDAGAISFGVNHVETQAGWGTTEPCPAQPAFTGVISNEDPAGEWSFGMQATSPIEPGRYALTLYVRTLETVDVSA